jgi:hypothetical protein
MTTQLRIDWGHTVAGSTPTLGTTGATVDVDATLATYTRDADSWITEGWKVGDRITFSGFANAGNNGPKQIRALTATVLTVENGQSLPNGSVSTTVIDPPAVLVTEADATCGAVPTAGQGGGAPSWKEVRAAILTLCANIGAGANAFAETVTDWSERGVTADSNESDPFTGETDQHIGQPSGVDGGQTPGPGQLAAVVRGLRDLESDEAGIPITWGKNDGDDAGDEINDSIAGGSPTQDVPTFGYPSPEELKAVLIAINEAI